MSFKAEYWWQQFLFDDSMFGSRRLIPRGEYIYISLRKQSKEKNFIP
jgi:hypothetical protein